MIAIERHLLLDFTYSQTRAGRPQVLFDQNQTSQPEEVLSPLISLAAMLDRSVTTTFCVRKKADPLAFPPFTACAIWIDQLL